MKLSSLSLSGVLLFGLLSLIAGFAPGKDEKEVRRPVTENFIQPDNTPANRPLSHVSWNIRRLWNATPQPPEDTIDAYQNRVHRPVVEVRNGTVLLRTAQGMSPLKLDSDGIALLTILPPEIPEPALALYVGPDDVFHFEPGTFALTDPLVAFGEPLDFEGLPLRWNRETQSCEVTPETRERALKILAELRELAGVSAAVQRRAERYSATVEQYAGKYKLTPELVYALIYTESSFNPALVSNRFAHGLMQVVPQTAGNEVHRWFGGEGSPESEVLLSPDTNIKYGTTYFHLLLTRHLGAIKNPESREYCAIAAYNTGSGAVLRTFAPTRSAAFKRINGLSPDEVRDILLANLPARETRVFLDKVLGMRERFAVTSGRDTRYTIPLPVPHSLASS